MKRLWLISMFISLWFAAMAETPDSIFSSCISEQKKPNFFKWAGGVVDDISTFLNDCDTNYVTPQKYLFSSQLELSYFHDYYRMRSSRSGDSHEMVLQSGNPLSLGIYAYWGPFGIGHSWNLEDIGKSSWGNSENGYRNSFMLNTARIIGEFYTFSSGKSAKFTRITNIDLEDKNREFRGLKSKCYGIDAQYIFNNKRYSWPAAFGENAVQKKAAGSWKAGVSYCRMNITFNPADIDPDIRQQIDTTLFFNRVKYTDYAINFGYSYNWPFKRNCLLAVSAIPSLGFRRSEIRTDYSRQILDNISTDLFFRASLFWNNTKYFSGIVVDIHTYSYREKKFSMTNSYGTIKYILGLNFIKKSQYR
ncbi:MAG: DUF4421 family protein [Prevotellaceae bacterium]|nr:DUF4421 family protein [Candidatus Colivivens equi]